MRLLPSDPDVETIVSRIESGDINLQPEFQRGEVWSKQRKQRLIDSILRDWHVPPIHVIENPHTRKQEVLDGQQRLAAIRDFVNGYFPVDGSIEPFEASISALNGCYYAHLPQEWRRRFNQFTIRIFRIVDYGSAEPAELFFRLNQPASLTGAEQRNAFFGRVREQIKDLVVALQMHGLDKNFLGFSNARMAYDDVLSRTAVAIERRSISEKITAGDLTDLYRSSSGLEESTTRLLEEAIGVLGSARDAVSQGPKFNKATLFSWLVFLIRARMCQYAISATHLAEFLNFFEMTRTIAARDPKTVTRLLARAVPVGRSFSIYENRSASRVADVSSVILRDAVLWLAFEEFSLSQVDLPSLERIGIARLHRSIDAATNFAEDDILAKRLVEHGWGHLV
jgi:hypothetical protein